MAGTNAFRRPCYRQSRWYLSMMIQPPPSPPPPTPLSPCQFSQVTPHQFWLSANGRAILFRSSGNILVSCCFDKDAYSVTLFAAPPWAKANNCSLSNCGQNGNASLALRAPLGILQIIDQSFETAVSKLSTLAVGMCLHAWVGGWVCNGTTALTKVIIRHRKFPILQYTEKRITNKR